MNFFKLIFDYRILIDDLILKQWIEQNLISYKENHNSDKHWLDLHYENLLKKKYFQCWQPHQMENTVVSICFMGVS